MRGIFANHGLDGLGQGLLEGRAVDVDGDGILDPGADYWTAYVFHTRDMVRQTMVDVMQVVRTLRGFDGQQQWAYDVDRNGAPELAGDFDGDGVVDVGGTAALHVIGGSLGGITTGVAAGVEPAFDSAIAIVPGGMLSEIGARSALGGVRNAMVLRMLGPLVYAKGNVLTMSVPEAEGNEAQLALHALPTLKPQDTVVLFDRTTGEHRCGAVQADGSFRVAVPSDTDDVLEFRAYAGPLAPEAETGCVVPEGVAATVTITTVDREVKYAGRTFAAGSAFTAVTDGFGLRRATPGLRRMLGLSQIALESGDPMNWAAYWEGRRTMTYGTGETVGTRVLVLPSIGDTGVPIASGIALSRAAGFIGYDTIDPRYGKSQSEVLVDTWAVEGLSRTARYTNSHGAPVLMDLENFASLTGADDGYRRAPAQSPAAAAAEARLARRLLRRALPHARPGRQARLRRPRPLAAVRSRQPDVQRHRPVPALQRHGVRARALPGRFLLLLDRPPAVRTATMTRATMQWMQVAVLATSGLAFAAEPVEAPAWKLTGEATAYRPLISFDVLGDGKLEVPLSLAARVEDVSAFALDRHATPSSGAAQLSPRARVGLRFKGPTSWGKWSVLAEYEHDLPTGTLSRDAPGRSGHAGQRRASPPSCARPSSGSATASCRDGRRRGDDVALGSGPAGQRWRPRLGAGQRALRRPAQWRPGAARRAGDRAAHAGRAGGGGGH